MPKAPEASVSAAPSPSANASTDVRRAAVDAILSRTSVSAKRLTAPGPTDDELGTMIAAAVTAPDHGSLRPWRFIRIADTARGALAEVFVEIRRRREPDATPAILQRDREKALNGPCLIAVVGRIRHESSQVPVSEQYASIGAAIMGVLVTAHLLGYGAIMLSGERVRDPMLREALGIAGAEELVGFITIGSIAAPPSTKPRPDPEDHLLIWYGNARDARPAR